MAVLFPIPVNWQKFLMITSQIKLKQFNSVLNPQNFTTHLSFKLIADRDTLVNFNFVPVSSSYVRTILHNPHPKKAVWVDGISSRLLRLSAPGIVNEITKLINFFINSQSWPQEWKCSIVNPVFKKDEDTNKANYRPISILTALSNAFQNSSVVEYVRSFKAPFFLFCFPENVRGLEEISRQKGSGCCCCHGLKQSI